MLLLALWGCVGSGLAPHLGFVSDDSFERDCVSVDEAEEGDFLWPGTRVSGERAPCEGVLHATGGAAGSTLTLDLAAWSGDATVELRDWNGTVLETHPVEASLDLTVPWTGEFLVAVLPGESDAGGAYALDATCTENCDRWTRHPILLMHGMGENDDWGLVQYTETLDALGYSVWNPVVDPFNPTAVRARQWKDHLEAWRSDGTWRRIHLIGHSMGGIDARYVASQLDDEGAVVSVTTLVSPHQGSPIADNVLHLVEEYDWADSTVQLLLDVIVPGHEGSQNVEAVLAQLSQPGMALFNENVPNREDVVYRSWGGMTCHWLSWSCQSEWDGEKVGWGLVVPLVMLQGQDVDASDGLVPLDSAVWGEFQGTLSADHLDMGGDHAPNESFDPIAFIAREASRLHAIERGEASSLEPLATGGVLGR